MEYCFPISSKVNFKKIALFYVGPTRMHPIHEVRSTVKVTLRINGVSNHTNQINLILNPGASNFSKFLSAFILSSNLINGA